MIRPLVAVSVGWLGLSMVADTVPALVVPHRLLAGGAGAGLLGMISLLAIGAAAVAQPFAGAWSDRVGRRPVIAVGVALALAGLVTLLSPLILVGTVLTLVGVSVAQAGYQSLLPDRIDPRWRGRGAGAKGLFDLGGAFLGFAILGGLLAAGREALAVALLGTGLVGALGISLLLLGRRGARLGPAVAHPATGPERGGALVQLIAARFLFLLGVYVVGRFLVLFVADRLGLEGDAAAGEAGVVLAILTLVTGLAALPSGWLADRFGRVPLMLGGGLVAAAGIGSLPLAGSIGAIVGLGILVALGTAAFGAASWASLADLSAGGNSGRRLGFANFGTAGAAAAAGLFGPLIDAGNRASPGAGYGATFMIAAAAAAAGGLLAWRTAAGARSASALIEVPD